MLPVEIIPAAEQELRGAAHHLQKERSANLKVDFLRKFAKARRDIQHFPEMWTPSIEGTRCKRMERFPYSIFYVIRNGRIVIVAVSHQARQPEYWIERLKEQQ